MKGLQELSKEIASKVNKREERVLERAILGTDWRETSVLRVSFTREVPSPSIEDPDFKMFYSTDHEIERYEDKAPPVTEHSDPDAYTDVYTITWPLLEELAEESEEIREIKEVALSPEQ